MFVVVVLVHGRLPLLNHLEDFISSAILLLIASRRTFNG